MHHLLEHINQDIKIRKSKDKDSMVNKTEYRCKKNPFLICIPSLSYIQLKQTSSLLFVMSNCDFVTFPCGVLGQVWYLIVLISDLCRLSYFDKATLKGART